MQVSMAKILDLLIRYKYIFLLFALLQHLFMGIFMKDLPVYTNYIWAINILIVGIASIGVFIEKRRKTKILTYIIFLLGVISPLSVRLFTDMDNYLYFTSILYCLFFLIIFWEVLRFLIRPSYINSDIIFASACGYLLLLEVSVYLLYFNNYHYPNAFRGIAGDSTAEIYIDLVYFCSIILTSIGFGDIVPNLPHTKLLVALIGIAGQFYSVVLVGILISKFTSESK